MAPLSPSVPWPMPWVPWQGTAPLCLSAAAGNCLSCGILGSGEVEIWFLNAREEVVPAGSTCWLRALSSHHFTCE